MSACSRPEDDALLKPIDLVQLLQKELNLGPCYDLKPKAVVELANVKLSRSWTEGANVKAECVSCREAVRALAPTFWTDVVAKSNSPPEELVTRILAVPATAGGFCSAVAAKVLSPKAIDTKTVAWGGSVSIDGSAVLRSPGQYCTTAEEIKKFVKLFKIDKTNEKLGDTVFHIIDKTAPCGGQNLMLMKSNKCSARLAALFTPKWCLLAVYHFIDVETEQITLSLLEDLRCEAFSNKK